MPANRCSALRRTRTIFPLLLLSLVWTLGTSGGLRAQDKALSGEKRAKIEKAVSAFMTASSVPGVQLSEPVTAAQPISTGAAPAAPPITMFWLLRRFSHAV